MYSSPIARALIGTFIQGVFYGLYIATLAHSLRWLLFEHEGWVILKKVNQPIITIATFTIFLLTTLNLSFGVGIMLRNDFFLSGSVTDTAVWTMTSLSGILTILIVDVVLVYRCYLVYGKSWKILCLPALFWIGALVSTISSVYYNESSTVSTSPIAGYMIAALRIGAAIYLCNIVTTTFATGAIAYRIFPVMKANTTSSKRLRNTIRILVDSGALYSSMTIFIFIVSLIQVNDVQSEIWLPYVLSNNMNFYAAIITFNLIIIRVHRNRNKSADSFADSQNVDGQTQIFSSLQCSTNLSVAITHASSPSES